MPDPLDLSFLPEPIRAAAILTNDGREAMWPRAVVRDAVEALAAHGKRVLGLDLRSDGAGETPAGLSTEIPWSALPAGAPGGPVGVAAGRDDALAALDRLASDEMQDYDWVLVTWDG